MNRAKHRTPSSVAAVASVMQVCSVCVTTLYVTGDKFRQSQILQSYVHALTLAVCSYPLLTD